MSRNMRTRLLFVGAMLGGMFLGIASSLSAYGGAALGAAPKKCIGLCFDVMNTTPSNVLANADQFADKAPYLDGVAIGLHDILVTDDNGNVVTSQFREIMHKSQRWTRDSVKSQLPYLKEIAKKPNLTESMLLFWMSPRGKNMRIDWRDDKGWANYAENMASVAWLAKEAGLKGLMLDPEEYAAQGGSLPQFVHTHEDPPYRETAKLARQRGREVFSRVFKEFPDAVILSLWFMSKFDFWLEDGYQIHPLQNTEQSGELLQYFLNGILDVIPPEARIVDGYEYYTGSALKNDYFCRQSVITTSALPLVAPENVTKYRAQVYTGNAHYLDMYAQKANPKSLWYYPPVNGSRLEHLRLNLEQSFRTATEYVWLYGERSGKLFNWRDGHYEKQKTWEEAIPGFNETVMLAKDPIGYAAKKKAELEKKGELKNLAGDVENLSLGVSSEIREFHQDEDKMPSVKVKRGERYGIVMATKEHGAQEGAAPKGEALPRVFYRKDGRQIGAKIDLKKDSNVPKDARGCDLSTVVVEIPEGVDELVCDAGARVALGEKTVYWRIEVYNLYDPADPVVGKNNGKKTFDSVTKNPTDKKWFCSKVPLKFRVFDYRHKRIYVKRFEKSLVASGLKPGEVYSVGLSVKRSGPGFLFVFPRFRGNGEEIKSPMHIPAIATADLREDNVWQPGEVVVRVPEGADELYLQIKAEITEDATEIELGDFKVYKIGEPLPVWPAEFERPHER